MFCKNCGKEIQDNVKFCPECGGSINKQEKVLTPENNNPIGNLIGGIIVFGLIWWGLDAFFWNVESPNFDNKMAQDAVQQYQVAKNQGDATEMCMQAGVTAQFFMQAKDQENYNKWKTIENNDCRRAGMY